MTKETNEKMDAFYLLGKYQALCSIMANSLKYTSNHDIYKSMVDDLKKETDAIIRGEKLIR